MELPWWLSNKESTCQCGRLRFHPWVGKIPEEGTGNPLQYSCLGNPMDRGEEPDGLWSMGPQESDMTYQLNNSMYVFIFLSCFDYSIILPLYLFIIENVITTESLAYFIS